MTFQGFKTVLTLDNKGRIVIPVKVRELLGLEIGEVLALEYQDGIIQLYPVDLVKKETEEEK